MKTLRLQKGKERWLVRYDEKNRSVTVEGPAPLSGEIHDWLSTPKHVVDRESGEMILVKPVESWTYLTDAVDVDLYKSLGIGLQRDDADSTS